MVVVKTFTHREKSQPLKICCSVVIRPTPKMVTKCIDRGIAS